jgi:hypothetical protein
MKHATQLNLPCEWPAIQKDGPVLGRHGSGIHYPIERVIRRYIPRKHMNSVVSLLPESLRDKVIGVNYSEIRILGPHVHLREQAAINFYQETNGEVTSFWDGEIVPDDRWSLDNGNGYYHVNHEILTPTEVFVAKPGDVWVLDSRKPHSVTYANDDRVDGYQFLPKNDDARFVIQAYFDTPYSEVLAELEKAGLVVGTLN